MTLTVPAHLENGIWFPETPISDTRADSLWSAAANDNAINAAAATTDIDPFAKFPVCQALRRDGNQIMISNGRAIA